MGLGHEPLLQGPLLGRLCPGPWHTPGTAAAARVLPSAPLGEQEITSKPQRRREMI